MECGTIEEKHFRKMKMFDNHSINNQDQELKESLKKQLESTTNWKERNSIETKLHNIEVSENEKRDTKIDYLLTVTPIFDKYQTRTEANSPKSPTPYGICEFTERQSVQNKGEIYKLYMNAVDNEPLISKQKNASNICKYCNNLMIYDSTEAIIICDKCGITETHLDISTNSLSYDQEINSEVNICFAYQRLNHFNEWLSQFQAKETTEIPQEILNQLLKEFKKIRITESSKITQEKVKIFLKKLRLNKFYEHSAIITNLLNGTKPKTMDVHLEEMLRNMFRIIQEPFEKHKPPERSNFLSYGYCLYKFCELLEKDEFLSSFPLLKSREKLYQQDLIWKRICQELNWEFIPTV
tara:strand:- start:7038 stop:8096 length:1059 start_codon:yes stop_codon:yes gene_type:complete